MKKQRIDTFPRQKCSELSINLAAPTEKDMDLSLYGSYRRLIAYPRDVEAEIVSHEDGDEDTPLTLQRRTVKPTDRKKRFVKRIVQPQNGERESI